jgi:hypothetical protein
MKFQVKLCNVQSHIAKAPRKLCSSGFSERRRRRENSYKFQDDIKEKMRGNTTDIVITSKNDENLIETKLIMIIV